MKKKDADLKSPGETSFISKKDMQKLNNVTVSHSRELTRTGSIFNNKKEIALEGYEKIINKS